MKTMLKLAVVFGIATVLVACDQNPSASSSTGSSAMRSSPMPSRRGDFATIVRGGQLFNKNCASCHGNLAQGAPGWQKVGANGKYPAPPLDGSGHAWHHPKKGLIRTIKYGTQAMGGSMPAWHTSLGDEDIEAIIQWFQSRWPDEIYRNWQVRDRQARR